MARTHLRIGWVAASTLASERPRFETLSPAVAMRIANVARWINGNDDRFTNEMYRPGHRYDAVVFHKTMDERARAEARSLKAAGAKVVFDANVNYYEVWGDYEIPGTRPTEEQQRDAVEMTRLADWVVADSRFLLRVVKEINERASWIPDNVDTRLYRPPRFRLRRRSGFRVVWSGVAKKALPLLDIVEPLAAVENAELVIVSDDDPPQLPSLREAVRTTVLRFEPRSYARILRTCDVIVSPKRLVNAYEVGHTEWKITLGMAAGLPAVASPQPSYVDAVGPAGGGLIVETADEWAAALARLRDDADLRRELGERARRTVLERYSTDVVAAAYRNLLAELC